MPGILVIDGGTTSFKAAIFDESLRLQGLASREFPVLRSATDRAELDPQGYWSSCVDTIREALRNSPLDVRQVAAIAVTSHTDTFFALDGKGEAVAPAILWSDPRSQPQAERIQREFGLPQLYRVTGQTGASSVHFAARLAWFYENRNDLARRAKHFLQTQDYLIFCLSGEAVIDHSIACCSLLAHLERPEYWPAMLTTVGAEMKKLSRIVQPGQVVAHLKPEVAKILGMPSGIPVIPAAMDAAAANVAIRSVASESVTDITGAALVIGVTCDTPVFDPQMRVPCFAHALPGKYLLLPWCETAGMALRWYRDNFFTPAMPGDNLSAASLYDQITAEAAQAPPGSDGVVLLPHFAGSGSPDFNPAAKACIFGLTLGHQRKHISRAFLESIAFLLKRNLDMLAEMGVKLVGITCAGGGSRSPLWCQIKADVTGLPVSVFPRSEATATGAAMLAATALGWSSSLAISPECGVATTLQPNPSAQMAYREAFQRFTWLNNLLQPRLVSGRDSI